MTEPTSLFDEWQRLNTAFHKRGVRPVLGGGFGLYVLQEHRLGQRKEQYLIEPERWPAQRTTIDLDLFLTVEILASATDSAAVREVLDQLGYVPQVKYWQFRNDSLGITVDLLTDAANDARLQVNAPRVRGKQSAGTLHAHQTPEALGLQTYAQQVALQAQMQPADFLIVGAPTYLLMKLMAYQDRNDPEFKRHDAAKATTQALDLLRIIAMLTREEFRTCIQAMQEFVGLPIIDRAIDIVHGHFGDLEGPGMRAIQRHPAAASLREEDLKEFLAALHDILPLELANPESRSST